LTSITRSKISSATCFTAAKTKILSYFCDTYLRYMHILRNRANLEQLDTSQHVTSSSEGLVRQVRRTRIEMMVLVALHRRLLFQRNSEVRQGYRGNSNGMDDVSYQIFKVNPLA
jgi:hypothetical protein